MTAIALHTDNKAAARGPLRDRLEEIQALAKSLDAEGVLKLGLKEAFPDRIAVVSSFAAE